MGVPNFHTTSDLIDESPQLSRDNNYLTSLVEQEICKGITIYCFMICISHKAINVIRHVH